MEIIDGALEEPASTSLFAQTVNPISTGCLLYKITDDVCLKFNFSQYTSGKIKTTIVDQMVRILSVYKKPSDMRPILTHIDIEGRNCMWYFNEY